ncbi:hypothetical protein HMPREF0539_2649 [Lacticaseibacillus rhamnosus LMS2-1]|uniref:Uncharacterized protein n=1 Tax=Lacticaseibacillus rhamnosus (strain LMS2-1) TaxID=525361 RepID=C2K0G4_LACRM|nr:hypothetical protein HMPREF0539_2649 [Lacticaseibacillus rhamnosus LMS2-1]
MVMFVVKINSPKKGCNSGLLLFRIKFFIGKFIQKKVIIKVWEKLGNKALT